jgi:peptidoglycan biosynthesis protein MviN/MurJ (putative lipid II flippase)
MRNARGITLASFSLAGTAMGLLGQILLFRAYGAGAALDMYFYSLAVPTFLAGQLSLVFGYYLVPFLVDLQKNGAKTEALLQGFAWLLLGGGAVLAVPGVIATALLAPSRAVPGLWLLTSLAWSSVVISNYSAVFVGLLNVQRRFLLAAALPIISQFGMLGGLLLLQDLGVVSAVIGLNAGGVIAVIVGWIGYRTSTGPHGLDGILPSPALAACRTAWQFFKKASVLPLVLAIFSAHFVIDALLALRLEPGGLSVLALAHRINSGATGLVVAAFAAPVTSSLAAASTDSGRFRTLLRKHIARITLFGATVCILLFVNAEPIALLMLEGGKVGASELQALKGILRVLSVAAMPMLLGQFLMRAMLARHEHAKAAKTALAWIAVYCLVAPGLSSMFGALGLALVYLLSWSTFCLVAIVTLKLWPTQPSQLRQLFLRLGVIACMAVISTTIASRLQDALHTLPGRWSSLLIVTTSAFLLALLALFADKALSDEPGASSPA